MKNTKALLNILFCSSILFACQQKNTEPSRVMLDREPYSTPHPNDVPGEISISYGYQDASVPPDYHRSYIITLTNENYRFVVDSYGHIIKDTTLVLPNQKERIEQALKAFDKCKIKNYKHKSEDMGCTGGNGEFIKITKDGERFFYGSNY